MSATIIPFPLAKTPPDFLSAMGARIEALRAKETEDTVDMLVRCERELTAKAKGVGKRKRKGSPSGIDPDPLLTRARAEFAALPLRDDTMLSESEVRQIRQMLREYNTICGECPVANRILNGRTE